MTKPYTLTTGCADAVDLALSATGMAINLAQAAGLPVQRRLEHLNLEIQEIQKDIAHALRQEEKPPRCDHEFEWFGDQVDSRRCVKCDTLESKVNAGSQVDPSQAMPSIPIPIANMLVNLHPQERIALDAAVRNGALEPRTSNDRAACESLFRKGVFRLNPESRYEIESKYAPWVKRAQTPHEILAALPVHLRELLRVLASRGGKIHVQPDGQHERDYYDLRERGILINDGATDRFLIARPYQDIAA